MGTIQNNEMKGEAIIQFEVKAGNIFEHKKKLAVLQKFASHDMETQAKIEKLLDLSKEDKDRVLQIINSPKALAALKKNWLMLKAMFA